MTPALGAVLVARCLARVLATGPLRDPPGQSEAMLCWYAFGVPVDGRRILPRDRRIPLLYEDTFGPVEAGAEWVHNVRVAACAVMHDRKGMWAAVAELDAQERDLRELEALDRT